MGGIHMEATNRRMKEKKPVLAICCDFDKILSLLEVKNCGIKWTN